LHAAFRRQDETVVLVDMGSANKTFINGQRVYPHEVRVVRSGDEIRLGKMIIKVTFNHT
jgi:pSer/pThr/pTyr-binding forkhead associated (FHA) protein